MMIKRHFKQCLEAVLKLNEEDQLDGDCDLYFQVKNF